MKKPILLLFFNRLDNLELTLGAIRSYEPSVLYLASDGARDYISGESKIVQDIRNHVINSIDWPCEIKVRFRDNNLGCKYAVHDAVQWFFSQERSGIVLEDDIVPTDNFFYYCAEFLDSYKDDKRVGSITGRNELQVWGGSDFFTASRFNCWGWASWSDRILKMDVEYGYNSRVDYSCLFDDCMWEERYYLDSVLGLLQTKQVSSWAYPYDLNFKKNKQLQIYPKKNMIKNIGFGPNGTHSFYKGVDVISVYNDFRPSIYLDLPMLDDKAFIRQKLRSEYGGVAQLFVMRYIRYLAWLRRSKQLIYKKLVN